MSQMEFLSGIMFNFKVSQCNLTIYCFFTNLYYFLIYTLFCKFFLVYNSLAIDLFNLGYRENPQIYINYDIEVFLTIFIG